MTGYFDEWMDDCGEPEAYDPPGIRWTDVSTIADNHEIQADVNLVGHFRHRGLAAGSVWIEGLPPQDQ